MPSRHSFRRRDRSEVSCVIKYLVFGFNVIFWIIGGLMAAAGLWAWSEKDTFSNIGKLTSIPDPAMFFVIGGAVIFVIGFSGCVGALRENTNLLLFYCLCIGIIFASQIVLGVLAFAYKDWVKNESVKQLKEMLIQYREDKDLQDVIDWVQEDWLFCCGVETYNDWDSNEYFNCSSPGAESCGVPFSCCKPDDSLNLKNIQCGYQKRSAGVITENFIYTEGCLQQGEHWLNENLIPVAGVVVAVALLQILGICFAMNLRGDIQAQKSKWREH